MLCTIGTHTDQAILAANAGCQPIPWVLHPKPTKLIGLPRTEPQLQIGQDPTPCRPHEAQNHPEIQPAPSLLMQLHMMLAAAVPSAAPQVMTAAPHNSAAKATMHKVPLKNLGKSHFRPQSHRPSHTYRPVLPPSLVPNHKAASHLWPAKHTLLLVHATRTVGTKGLLQAHKQDTTRRCGTAFGRQRTSSTQGYLQKHMRM
jgi:hypothetical protein